MGLRARFGHAADSPGAPISYRRSLGLGWLIGLVVIPLLIAAIGYGALERSRAGPGPAGAAPPVASSGRPGKPPLSLAPLSIVRTVNDVTLTGEFPDDSAKAVLTRVLKAALPAGVDIIDQIGINPNVDALDFSNAGPIFTNSASITNFNLTVNGNTITLTGTAASQDQKNTIDSDAAHTWSNLTVVDRLAVDGAPPPPPAPAGQCGDLQSAINAVTGGPITFGNDGFSLTPADDQMLTQVADKLKACPNVHATINGYTDNSGTEAVNIPLSDNRAQTVTNFLVAQGVTSNRLIVRGLGSINPVAGDDTADGRAKNRRVEIVVG